MGMPAPATHDGWLRRHLRTEDALLFLALVVIEPLLFPARAGSTPKRHCRQ